MHKNSWRARFIIASKLCSTKQLSKLMSFVVKLIKNCHNKFWVFQDCDPIINTLNKTSKRKNAKCISTYDFSTLYAKITLNKLLNIFFQPIDFVFQGGTKTFIKVRVSGNVSLLKKLNVVLNH